LASSYDPVKEIEFLCGRCAFATADEALSWSNRLHSVFGD